VLFAAGNAFSAAFFWNRARSSFAAKRRKIRKKLPFFLFSAISSFLFNLQPTIVSVAIMADKITAQGTCSVCPWPSSAMHESAIFLYHPKIPGHELVKFGH